jgi:hypothetical protein
LVRRQKKEITAETTHALPVRGENVVIVHLGGALKQKQPASVLTKDAVHHIIAEPLVKYTSE